VGLTSAPTERLSGATRQEARTKEYDYNERPHGAGRTHTLRTIDLSENARETKPSDVEVDEMKEYLKTLVGKLPTAAQLKLKEAYYAHKIKRDDFSADEPEYFRLGEWISDGDWVIDVGANVGHYTHRLSSLCGSSGRVIACEPVPETFTLLACNVSRFSLQNVSLLNVAASDQFRAIEMAIPKTATGLANLYMASVQHESLPGESSSKSAFSIPLDCLQFPRGIALIKIDAEGHELSVINGLLKTIETHRPTLIIEGTDPQIRGLLEKYGYTFEEESGSPNRVYTSSSSQSSASH
jgi:FkbM family methyltransferase